ncbi:hypothetical protein ACIBF6_38315 [Streptosporangium amethystogenes]|uniref:hypothetical protein n=1 Tax=Streptosporangium amethystogenes TaxID=2002 RepID=UPI00378C0E82
MSRPRAEAALPLVDGWLNDCYLSHATRADLPATCRPQATDLAPTDAERRFPRNRLQPR